VARTVDPGRKPELLARILEYLLEQPLATVTFRTLASALGVSTYTLVYHFGTRANLLAEVVGAVSERQQAAQDKILAEGSALDDYFEAYEAAWAWVTSPEGRRRGLIDFEAAVLTARDGQTPPAMAAYERWNTIAIDGLLRAGIPAGQAHVLVRAMIAVMHGLKYDYVITGDANATTTAFRHVLEAHRAEVLRLIDRRVTESTGG